jgi:hypothetical protein
MYHTERDPFSGKKLFVEKEAVGRERQKIFWLRKKAGSGMEIADFSIATETPLNKCFRATNQEDGSWVRIKTSKRKPRRNLPKR